MKTNFVLAAAALALGACATATPDNEVLIPAQIIAGKSTRVDVDKLVGKPYQTVALKAAGQTESTYAYKDIWGYAMALFVTYDARGVVVAKYVERRQSN